MPRSAMHHMNRASVLLADAIEALARIRLRGRGLAEAGGVLVTLEAAEDALVQAVVILEDPKRVAKVDRLNCGRKVVLN